MIAGAAAFASMYGSGAAAVAAAAAAAAAIAAAAAVTQQQHQQQHAFTCCCIFINSNKAPSLFTLKPPLLKLIISFKCNSCDIAD